MNLREALEELEDIIKELEEPPERTDDDDGLNVQFTHLYHHINSAWNARFSRPDYAVTFTDKDYDRDQEFPTDINFWRLCESAEGAD